MTDKNVSFLSKEQRKYLIQTNCLYMDFNILFMFIYIFLCPILPFATEWRIISIWMRCCIIFSMFSSFSLAIAIPLGVTPPARYPELVRTITALFSAPSNPTMMNSLWCSFPVLFAVLFTPANPSASARQPVSQLATQPAPLYLYIYIDINTQSFELKGRQIKNCMRRSSWVESRYTAVKQSPGL